MTRERIAKNIKNIHKKHKNGDLYNEQWILKKDSLDLITKTSKMIKKRENDLYNNLSQDGAN